MKYWRAKDSPLRGIFGNLRISADYQRAVAHTEHAAARNFSEATEGSALIRYMMKSGRKDLPEGFSRRGLGNREDFGGLDILLRSAERLNSLIWLRQRPRKDR
jgi:hypothetical protein